MKKKIFIIGASALLLCGCGKTPKLSNGDEAVVKFKDGTMISANDFYNEIKDSMGLQTLINMIDKYIYEHEFADSKVEAEEYAKASIKSLRTNYSTDAEILQLLQMYGLNYQTVDAYQEYLYNNFLQNEAAEAYVKSIITESELKDYYKENIYPDMDISHILITPKVEDETDEEAKKKAEAEAKEKIENIIKELNNAKKNNKDITEEFKRLAKENTEDDATKDKGGSLGTINIGSLDTTYDELIKSANKLKDGEYSTEVITTEAGYHVILKTKTAEKKAYDDVIDEIKSAITKNKLSENYSLRIDAIRHYREEYGLEIIDSEMDSQYGKYMNNLINSYKNSNNS